MKRWAGVIWILSCILLQAITEPPLPVWNGEERAQMQGDGWVAGSSLLTYDPLPKVREPGDTPLAVEEPTAEELEELFANENVVAEEFLAEYFEKSSKSFLLDPQNLLNEADERDLEALLVEHSKDSSIDIRLYLFGKDQIIPGDVREEEVVERLYSSGKPALVIYYYLGAPQLSDIYLSPILTDAVSAGEQRRALQSSVVQAFKSANTAEQLRVFLVQMSIRTYWMEQMAIDPADEVAETILDTEPAVVALNAELPDEGLAVPTWVKLLGGGVAVGFGTLLISWIIWTVVRKRLRYRFPEFEIEPRMGGSHAAGVGAVISFSNSSAPPANQRSQVPDYLRRA